MRGFLLPLLEASVVVLVLLLIFFLSGFLVFGFGVLEVNWSGQRTILKTLHIKNATYQVVPAVPGTSTIVVNTFFNTSMNFSTYSTQKFREG